MNSILAANATNGLVLAGGGVVANLAVTGGRVSLDITDANGQVWGTLRGDAETTLLSLP